MVTTKNDFYLRLAAAGGAGLGLAQQPDKVNANHCTGEHRAPASPGLETDWKLESKAGPGSLAWTQASAPPGDSWENMDGSHILIQDIHRGNE